METVFLRNKVPARQREPLAQFNFVRGNQRGCRGGIWEVDFCKQDVFFKSDTGGFLHLSFAAGWQASS